MRILNREAFLKEPEGVVYAVGIPWVFGPWCIKGDSIDNDWFYVEINAWATNESSSTDTVDAFEHALRTGDRLTFDPCGCRDGGFDEDAIFCVMDRADVDVLIYWLNKAPRRELANGKK